VKWNNFIKDYEENGECYLKWELFAESLVKLPEAKFISPDLIDFYEDQIGSLGEDEGEYN
jgi:hypothetical protein